MTIGYFLKIIVKEAPTLTKFLWMSQNILFLMEEALKLTLDTGIEIYICPKLTSNPACKTDRLIPAFQSVCLDQIVKTVKWSTSEILSNFLELHRMLQICILLKFHKSWHFLFMCNKERGFLAIHKDVSCPFYNIL